jgi:putative chitinase
VVLTAETFKKFSPTAKAEYITAIGAKGDEILARFGINANKLRFCHFLAQVAHESAGFKAVEENLNYSAERMMVVFPRARISASEAQQLARKPQAIAERVYGLGFPDKARELGNTQPGDGFRYRGRGFIQLTGRGNYRDIGKRIGLDLEGNPDLAAQPANALLCAAAFWDGKNLNQFADQNKIEVITKLINGAHHGLADRKTKFAAAQGIWGGGTRSIGPLEGVGGSLGPSGFGGRPTLQYGDLGPDVLEAKRLLADAGYSDFLMDEDFSRAMHMAVVQFKMDRGLPGDGIVDAATWAALGQGAQPEASRGIGPGGKAFDDEAERSRRRGRKIEGMGRLLFVAAAVVVAVRLVLDGGIVVPTSRWEWTVLGFLVLTAVVSIALMTIGGAMVREGRTRRISAGALADLGTRASPDGEDVDVEQPKAA